MGSLLGQDESITAHARLQEVAEQAGQDLFDALQQAYVVFVACEEAHAASCPLPRVVRSSNGLVCRRCGNSGFPV